MFRPTEWGSSKGSTTTRRLFAISALTITAVAATSLPASADSDGLTAHASASVIGQGTDGAGHSEATWPDNAGPNASGPVTTVPLSDTVDFGQGGGMQSVSTTTSPYDASALSGFIGSDGQVTFDRADGGFAPASVDLLAYLKKGGTDLSDALVDEATLRLGIGGSEVITRDGQVIDQDGVGGLGRYRLGQADLELGSPKVKEAAAQMYDAVGRLDDVTETQVNSLLDLTKLTSALPTGGSVTARVHSDMQDQVFKRLLAQPITTKNKVLTVDFSTGRATLHLDQLLHGEEVVDGPLLPGQTVRPGDPTGLNSQAPNTEIIDDEIYPMIAETIHDLIDEVVTIAVGSVAGALGSVTVDFTATLKGILNSTAVSTWSVNLMGSQVKPATCTSSGLAGPALCTVLTAVVNTAVVPLATKLLVPVRDFLLSDAGANLYGLAIQDLKTGMMTAPLRAAIDPFLQTLAQNVSLQLNAQRPQTCTAPDGTRRTSGLQLSALSLAFRRAAAGPRLDFGNAEASAKCDGTWVG